MLDLLTIALEAHSDERNHHRRYEVAVDRDLLGDWTVTIRFGRVGWPLRELKFGSPAIERAQTIVQDRLQRRLSAPRRIGCRYRLRHLSMAAPVDVTDWVPVDLLERVAGTIPTRPDPQACAAQQASGNSFA